MISRIGPLVQAGERRTAAPAHVLGGVMGASAAGLLLSLPGVFVGEGIGRLPTAALASMLAAVVLYAVVFDARLLTKRRLTWSRQTPGGWECALGPTPAAFAWGVDLGTVVTTRLPYEAVLVLPAYALLSQDVLAATCVMAVYGATRSGLVVALTTRRRGDFARICTTVGTHEAAIRRLVVLVSCVFIVVLSATALGG
jgi:hypothetical protein